MRLPEYECGDEKNADDEKSNDVSRLPLTGGGSLSIADCECQEDKTATDESDTDPVDFLPEALPVDGGLPGDGGEMGPVVREEENESENSGQEG